MTEKEFNLMYALHKNLEDYSDDEAKKSCEEKGWVKDRTITDAGYQAMLPYKVDNAIIMAAGRSKRCMPLSNYLPKGLFEIKGETMVDRQIMQLHDAGIKEIVLVVGYLKEKYYPLKDKYKDLIIIDNTEWDEKNNISSVYAAQEYMKNSYLCCSDNWFAHNVFREYVYDSYYACKYTDEFIDEYCVKGTDKNGYITSIKKGGEKTWYTIGEAFFKKEFSQKFIELLRNEYYDPEIKYMLWDDFHIKHIDQLKLKIKGYSDEECKEFDTTEDILQFYPNFKNFIEQFFQEEEMLNSAQRLDYLSNYAETKQYSVVSTDQLTGRLHVNENLFGPSPKCLEMLKNVTMEDIYQYDLTRDDELALAISEQENISMDNIFIHSGSSDVIKTIMTIVLNKGDSVMIPAPAWNYYKSVIELRHAKAVYYNVVPDKDEYVHDVAGILSKSKECTPRIIILTTPHNPTGATLSGKDLEKIIRDNPKSLVIVDEAYLGYSDITYDVTHLLNCYSNVVFSRTFSKLYGLASMRVGYGLCSSMAKQVFRLDLNPFRISTISRRMAVVALKDKEYYDKMTKDVIECRNWFIQEVNKIPGVKAFNSYANFVFMHLDDYDTQKIKDKLAKAGYLVRLWTENGHLAMRITLAPKEIMVKVLELLKETCKSLMEK
ncbi:MAG: aminotransferase class I/II-fold pyridoxal phosphate-dependent enzyme [Spirochaetaceae bacterium]|nr:aminotransferase class I/II-fold pyridoxal phosphate-dependent enzyme [Spirochaetaceae bacterium]